MKGIIYIKDKYTMSCRFGFIGIKRTSLIHSVRLTGLIPGMTYRYRVYVKEVLAHKGYSERYGNVTATNVFRRL